jgi:hypothetical protein
MQFHTVDRLRRAVSSGDYTEAGEMLGDFRKEMQAMWEAAASAEERAGIVAEVSDLLEWARTATLTGRAHAQRKLILLTRRNAYTQNPR